MPKSLFVNQTVAGDGKGHTRAGNVVRSGLIRGENTGTGTGSLDFKDARGGVIAQITVEASKALTPTEVALPAAYYATLTGTNLNVTAWVDGDDS